jgi:hypothetical protein
MRRPDLGRSGTAPRIDRVAEDPGVRIEWFTRLTPDTAAVIESVGTQNASRTAGAHSSRARRLQQRWQCDIARRHETGRVTDAVALRKTKALCS